MRYILRVRLQANEQQQQKKSSAKVYVFESQESPMQSQCIHTQVLKPVDETKIRIFHIKV